MTIDNSPLTIHHSQLAAHSSAHWRIRVKQRVKEGGHNIQTETIKRRYVAGLKNFFTLYQNVVNYWLFIDNSIPVQEVIAETRENAEPIIYNNEKWFKIQEYANKKNI